MQPHKQYPALFAAAQACAPNEEFTLDAATFDRCARAFARAVPTARALLASGEAQAATDIEAYAVGISEGDPAYGDTDACEAVEAIFELL